MQYKTDQVKDRKINKWTKYLFIQTQLFAISQCHDLFINWNFKFGFFRNVEENILKPILAILLIKFIKYFYCFKITISTVII